MIEYQRIDSLHDKIFSFRPYKGRYFVNLAGETIGTSHFVRDCLFVRARDSPIAGRDLRSAGKSHNKTAGEFLTREFFHRICRRAAPAVLVTPFFSLFPVQIAQWTDRPAGGQFVWMDNDSPGRAQWLLSAA